MKFSTIAVFAAIVGSANGFALNQAAKPLAFATAQVRVLTHFTN